MGPVSKSLCWSPGGPHGPFSPQREDRLQSARAETRAQLLSSWSPPDPERLLSRPCGQKHGFSPGRQGFEEPTRGEGRRTWAMNCLRGGLSGRSAAPATQGSSAHILGEGPSSGVQEACYFWEEKAFAWDLNVLKHCGPRPAALHLDFLTSSPCEPLSGLPARSSWSFTGMRHICPKNWPGSCAVAGPVLSTGLKMDDDRAPLSSILFYYKWILESSDFIKKKGLFGSQLGSGGDLMADG